MIILLIRKILIGALVALIPFLIYYAGLWLVRLVL